MFNLPGFIQDIKEEMRKNGYEPLDFLGKNSGGALREMTDRVNILADRDRATGFTGEPKVTEEAHVLDSATHLAHLFARKLKHREYTESNDEPNAVKAKLESLLKGKVDSRYMKVIRLDGFVNPNLQEQAIFAVIHRKPEPHT